jgi:CRISPR-associated endonuclease/helicase Cas3
MKRIDLSKYPGKPSGLPLSTHTENVEQMLAATFEKWPFLAEKYRVLTGQDLVMLCELAAHYHDYGKALKPWREPCKKDVALYQDWLKKKSLPFDPTDHAAHAAYEREVDISAPAIRQAGFRHELGSVAWLLKNVKDLPHESLIGVAAHHGKLSKDQRHASRWESDGNKLPSFFSRDILVKAYQNLKAKGEAVSNKSFASSVLARYQYAAVRSLLQIADTRASRLEGMGNDGMVALQRFTKPLGFGPKAKLRPVQSAAVKNAKAERTILRAPTGSGKTYASLLWASEQILGERPTADRLIIAMPTRFTSNALYAAVGEQVNPSFGKPEDLTALHHSSAFFKLYGEDGDSSWGSEQVEKQKLAKLLAYPTTVCTIDHLLACLTGTKEEHYTSFFLLANSCVVFDETDFYDDFVQQNLVQLLEVLRLLKVPTLIMSATVPDSARTLYGVEEAIVEVAQPGSERVIKHLYVGGQVVTAADSEEILAKMIEQGNGIIYANTIARALDYYSYLEGRCEEIPVVIYHSRFTEPDKLVIEQELEAMLGKTAHRKEDQPRGIAILTQIGEMSINISSEIMLTDCCPWDRLAQRVGRLARFAIDDAETTTAEVYVVFPVKEKNGEITDYPAPYGEPDQKWKWKAYPAYQQTADQLIGLNKQPYRLTPAVLVAHANSIYKELAKPSDKAIQNRNYYRDLIRDNWLLTGSVAISEDETVIGKDWSTRDIPSQMTVVTDVPHGLHFKSWNELRNHIHLFGISCPKYKIEQDQRIKEGEGKRCLRLQKLNVGFGDRQQEIELYVVVKGAYVQKTGLASLYGYPWSDADEHNL